MVEARTNKDSVGVYSHSYCSCRRHNINGINVLDICIRLSTTGVVASLVSVALPSSCILTHTITRSVSLVASTMKSSARTSTGQHVTAFVIVSPRESRAPIYALKGEHQFCTQMGTADDESMAF